MNIVKILRYLLLAQILTVSQQGQSQQASQSQANQTVLYTMEDLQITAEQQNPEEFFRHYRDLPPRLRDDQWNKMVIAMGRLWVQNMAKSPRVSKQEMEQMVQMAQVSQLKEDIEFQQYYQKIGTQYFDKCFLPNPMELASPVEIANCWIDLKRWWRYSNKDFKSSIHIAKTLYQSYRFIQDLAQSNDDITQQRTVILDNASSITQLIQQWITPGLKSPVSQVYCKQAWVQDYLWLQLEKISDNVSEKNFDLTLSFGQYANQDCWKIMQKKLFDSVYLNDQTIQQNNLAQNILKKSKEAIAFTLLPLDKNTSEAEKDYLFTLYLLMNPQKSDLYNLAWSNLKELGQDQLRRHILLEKLKKIDPLPDEFLTSADEFSQRVTIKEFDKRFPEWFQNYRVTCLKYLKGEDSFPKGNPTVHCRKFYHLLKSAPQEIIPISLLSPFKKYFDSENSLKQPVSLPNNEE